LDGGGGFATLTGGRQDCRTPPWPGPYRVGVHVRGRDGDDVEGHRLVVWSAPVAPPIVHRRTDRLGHRLRGEPEPPVVTAPEAAFRWVHRGRLSMAATITSVTGLTPDEVVRAFGADPGAPLPLEGCQDGVEWVPAVAVRECGDVVVAVEVNGFRGSDEAVLRELSRAGRAASMFWNAKALTCLSFARGGEVLWAEELLDEMPTSQDPEVQRALQELDFDDYRHLEAKGITAVARFTGGGSTDTTWNACSTTTSPSAPPERGRDTGLPGAMCREGPVDDLRAGHRLLGPRLRPRRRRSGRPGHRTARRHRGGLRSVRRWRQVGTVGSGGCPQAASRAGTVVRRVRRALWTRLLTVPTGTWRATAAPAVLRSAR